MLRQPKKSIRESVKANFKGFLAVELALFGFSYYVFHRMNTSREYRYYMNENFPYILSGFYKVGETLGNLTTRQDDQQYWTTTNKKG